MVRVAIVGYGGMGRVHHESYKKLENASVTAICDISVDFSRIDTNAPEVNISTSKAEGSSDTDIAFFRDTESLLEQGEFDAVDICLPTFLHAEYAVRFLEAGYPVMTEKPMALDTDSAQEMIDASKSTGQLLSVAQCLRFWPAYAEIKRIIDSGEYGDVRYGTFCRYGGAPGWSWENWMHSEARSGGALLDLHIHDTDIIQYLFGTPNSVVSTGTDEEGIGIRHVDTLYRYPDKVVHGSGGWSATSSYGFKMMAKVALEKAFLVLDFAPDTPLTIYPDGADPFGPELAEGDGYFHEAADFVRCVESRTPSSIITPESAAESVRICHAETKSVREKREIDL